MSETTPNAKGPAPVQYTPEATEPVLIPADQVKPEDIGTLSIEYRGGQPVVVVSGGRYVPARLTVADGAGNAVAAYSVGAPSLQQSKVFVSEYAVTAGGGHGNMPGAAAEGGFMTGLER
ncbi:hypothetical protein SSP531S_50480 [Streptomyces spongiicola]|uniref:Uncharacterized protein n=1 Tax=Streptomyces spongiicola TaxID=1690221 RepID=A0A388T3R0_9ACTN|nr:hypothetical protein [Streptomyces spongiicola]GBQ03573.1 hypothetical protein SSP531S_50480 [Streptomyces spongiicola]